MDDRQDYDQNADYDFFVEQLPALLDNHQGQVALISRSEKLSATSTQCGTQWMRE